MSDLYTAKSHVMLAKFVMGLNGQDEIRRTRNQERFKNLQIHEQETIRSFYQKWQGILQQSFNEKLEKSLRLLFLAPSPFMILWLTLAIVLSLMVLLKKEGANHAIWLVPLAAFAYSIDNHLSGLPRQPSAEEALFPTQTELLNNYQSQQTHQNEREELLTAWHHYLALEWSTQKIVNDKTIEEGRYAFTLARIRALTHPSAPPFSTKDSLYFLAAIFIWNFSYAATIFRYTKISHCPAEKNTLQLAQNP